MRLSVGFGALIAVLGCTVPPEPTIEAPETPVIAAMDAPAPPPEARRVDEFDTTTEEQRLAALEPTQGGVLLGDAVLTLGDPGRAGFWVETSLVSAPGEGRVALAEGGKSVEVALLPGSQSGRISLAALRLLEAPLTALLEVKIYENQ